MAGMADCLKEFREVETTTSGGREFQSLIDLGKNLNTECSFKTVDQYNRNLICLPSRTKA